MQPSLTFAQWRDRARPLLEARVAPEAACTAIAGGVAPAAADLALAATPVARPLVVPPRLLHLLDDVSCFRSQGRYELMYRLTWRTLFENRRLVEDAADPDVRNAMSMAAAVRREVHKMHAFVRFRALPGDGAGPAYAAWFEPEHDILRRGARFFIDRFPNMKWTIATPRGAAVWDTKSLTLAETPGRDALPADDGYEGLWRTYYRHICNVARINPSAMQRQMPPRFWQDLPETSEIAGLLRQAWTAWEDGGRAKSPA